VFYPHWSPTPLIAGIPAGFFLYFFLKPLFVALSNTSLHSHASLGNLPAPSEWAIIYADWYNKI